MNVKSLIFAAVIALSACAANLAVAPNESPAAEPDMFTRMNEMSEAFHATSDPEERRALMYEHMELMIAHMRNRSAMMADSGMMPGEVGAEAPDMEQRMGMMHNMMMEMMSQQNMMMEMMSGPGRADNNVDASDSDDHSERHE